MTTPARLLRLPRITRTMVRTNRDTLYVFGDNMQRTGRGGQAREMRGEPNTIGVPTKWGPGRREADYFSDADADNPHVRDAILGAFAQIRHTLHLGRNVVIPADGLGTGLAELPVRAPRLHALIEAGIAGLGDVNV